MVLGLEASSRVADLIGLDELLRLEVLVGEDSDVALIGVLCPLELTTLVGATLLSPILGLDEVFVTLLDPLTRLVGITIPDGLYIGTIAAESHGDDPRVELALMLE